MAEDVYCTLLMSDSYLPGAAVLAHSLRDTGASKKLAVLVTLESLLSDTVSQLRDLYDYVLPVERLANPSLENLHRLDRLDLRFSFTKIALWKQVQFRKIVYIDADAVALRAPDELFDLPFPFAAAPDVGWPDLFNTGVMLLSPDMSEYWSLHTLASSGTSFDGADQGLFNEHFANRSWHRISFTYNCTPNASYQYEPAYRHFRSSITVVHFIGKDKPWTMGREHLSSSTSAVFKELLGRWWATYDRHYRISYLSNSRQVATARIIQQYVKGEHNESGFDWATEGAHSETSPPPPPPSVASPLQAPSSAPLDEQVSELLDREGAIGKEPAQKENMEQPFVPPPMAWDATRSEPPMKSAPEAKDFPSAHYEMSHDPSLFRSPISYPEPPKDLYYGIPQAKSTVSEKPKPIFPWEEAARKPTRVFADDPSPLQPAAFASQGEGSAASATSASRAPSVPPSSPPQLRLPPSDSFQAFSRTNAWDEISSIDTYIRAVKKAQQARRAQIQVLHTDAGVESQDTVESPTSPPAVTQRRESLILTDFPTEIERPSLPVTPAPVERETFWGEERDVHGNYPGAQGVPEQADWNPVDRLEQLRRSSVAITEDLPKNVSTEIPQRGVPESSKGLGSSPPISSEPQVGGLATSLASASSSSTAATNATQTLSLSSSEVRFQAPDFGRQVDDTVGGQVDEAAGGQTLSQGKPSDLKQLDEYSIA